MFHIGQMVVCVADDWNDVDVFGEKCPVKGHVYTIRCIEIGIDIGRDEEAFFRFDEIVNPILDYPSGRADANFHARAFRPVKQTSIDCFTSILNQTPQKVDA